MTAYWGLKNEILIITILIIKISSVSSSSSSVPSYSTVFAAGCVGGAAQLLVACPSDVVKIVLQSQIPETREWQQWNRLVLICRELAGPSL